MNIVIKQLLAAAARKIVKMLSRKAISAPAPETVKQSASECPTVPAPATITPSTPPAPAKKLPPAKKIVLVDAKDVIAATAGQPVATITTDTTTDTKG